MSGINKTHSIKEFKGWERIFPERFAPGIIPDNTYYSRFHNNNSIDAKIDSEITNTIQQEKPSFKKYYHDGTEINWNNLEESNKNYLESYHKLANTLLEKQTANQKIGESIVPQHDLYARIEEINEQLKPYLNKL
jgi:hypothetical protein